MEVFALLEEFEAFDVVGGFEFRFDRFEFCLDFVGVAAAHAGLLGLDPCEVGLDDSCFAAAACAV